MLMRAIAQELAERIGPELRGLDAIERANFAKLVLQNLAADREIMPTVAEALVPQFEATLSAALARIDPTHRQVRWDAHRSELAALRAKSGVPVELRLVGLRQLAARWLREFSEPGNAVPDGIIDALGRIDAQWLIEFDRACRASAPANDAASNAALDGNGHDEALTPATLTRYLRRRLTEEPDAEVIEVVPIPGGRSKKTFFLTLRGSRSLPERVVMRQDFALKYAGTQVRDEYRPLQVLSEMGLPVPRPRWLEPEASEAGPPFMLVERLPGKPPGTYFGMAGAAPGAFRDLAELLAKLHAMPVAATGIPDAGQPGDRLRQLIHQYEDKWRTNATRASPIIDYAYAWALRECGDDPGFACAVHGDAGPYNLLVEQDRLEALLDWEFAHVGDPAEDLGIARVYAEGFMPWEDFLGAYARAGGPAVVDRRIQLGMLLQFLKGTTLVAASGRNFIEGGTRDFIKGANAYTGLRLIEMRILELLRKFGAV